MNVTPIHRTEQLTFSIQFPEGVEFTEPPVFKLSANREWEAVEENYVPEQAVRFSGMGNIKAWGAARRSNGKWGPVFTVEALEVKLEP